MVASVALVSDDITIAEYSANYKKTHSQTLLPMLDEIVKMVDCDLKEIDAIAIAAGPGSFTGLRIGSATAKGLALALNKPIVPVPTCDALAFNLCGTDKIVCPIMDAKRNQVYFGVYEFLGEKLHELQAQDVWALSDVLELLVDLNREVIFLGDGVPVYKDQLEEKLGDRAHFALAHQNRQRASAVASLGKILYEEGITESCDEHKPIYLRKSQAEREREARLAKKEELSCE